MLVPLSSGGTPSANPDPGLPRIRAQHGKPLSTGDRAGSRRLITARELGFLFAPAVFSNQLGKYMLLVPDY
jgi:hypothetical protein